MYWHYLNTGAHDRVSHEPSSKLILDWKIHDASQIDQTNLDKIIWELNIWLLWYRGEDCHGETNKQCEADGSLHQTHALHILTHDLLRHNIASIWIISSVCHKEISTEIWIVM